MRKVFGGLVAVDDVSFHIARGEIVGLIGPNGAGKSTLVNLVMGVYRPDAGAIVFNGEHIANERTDQVVKRGIARTFQVEKPLLNMTARGNVMIGAMLHNPKHDAAMTGADRRRRGGQCSGGERGRQDHAAPVHLRPPSRQGGKDPILRR